MKSFIGVTGCSGSLGKILLRIGKKIILYVLLAILEIVIMFEIGLKK